MERTLEKKMSEAKASAATLNAFNRSLHLKSSRKMFVSAFLFYCCSLLFCSGSWRVLSFSVSIISEKSVPSPWFKVLSFLRLLA
ncbi:unnamed protein product [Brassica oleracea var. botrytis]